MQRATCESADDSGNIEILGKQNSLFPRDQSLSVKCDIQNNQGRGRGNQPKPKAKADNPYRDLDYAGYHQKSSLIIVLLYTERKKKHGCHVFFSSLTGSNAKRANLT